MLEPHKAYEWPYASLQTGADDRSSGWLTIELTPELARHLADCAGGGT